MAQDSKKLYTMACVGTATSMLTYGWDAGVLGGILQTSEFTASMKFPNTTMQSVTTSVFLLGSWLGCILMSIFGMRQGRKTWLLVGNAISIVGTVISASSYSYGQMIAGRTILGIGNGLITSMGPIFIAEMTVNARHRGRAVNGMIASATVGTASAYWVDFGMVFASTEAVWRFPIAFQAAFSIISISVLFSLPDTPRWYYAVQREAEGDDVLARLHGVSIDDMEVTKREILASIELESFEKHGLRLQDFFWDRSEMQTGRRIRTGMIIYSLTYLSGLDFIFYYTTTIFQVYIGLPPTTASGLAGLATTVLCVFAWLSCYLVERIGRRTWLVGGAVLQTLFFCPFIGLLAHPSHATGAAAAAMLFFYICSNAATWAPFSSVYVSEIMPLRYRHLGFSLGISCQWLFAFVTVFAGPIGEASIGWKILTWLLCFNVISIFYVYFFCPETRGKTLEEIDLVFMSSNLRATSAGQLLERAGGEKRADSQTAADEEKTTEVRVEGATEIAEL